MYTFLIGRRALLIIGRKIVYIFNVNFDQEVYYSVNWGLIKIKVAPLKIHTMYKVSMEANMKNTDLTLAIFFQRC